MLKNLISSLLGLALCSAQLTTSAQCPAGEVEVTIDIQTDAYGYEMYWELLPQGNACGSGTIFSGGNTAVGCNGAGAQAQIPGGYGNNTTYTEGPWCLTENADFDIFWADDWGDGGFSATVYVNGVYKADFTGVDGDPAERFTFNASAPLARDLSVTGLTVPVYAFHSTDIYVEGTIRNLGGTTVTDFDLNFSIDGGAPTVGSITGLSISPGADYEFTSTTPWTPSAVGTSNIEVWATNINGQNDQDPSNDMYTSGVILSDPIPNIVDNFLSGTPNVTTVANSNEDLLVPRDLDFHPEMVRRELWVINKDTENSGGSTVTFTDIEGPNQAHQWKRDGNAWHFMSLPTGMAMGDNGLWASSPGVYDANHNGAPPFTGPSLWESDMSIYAEPAGPGTNGSHMDMLHESPYAQGIAHEKANVYWVVDGHSNDVVRYDFKDDHGPGMHYHGDAIVRRYSDFVINKDPNDHIVSHCVLDKEDKMLYIVDHGNQRIIRLDITTGTIGGTPPFASGESLTEYTMCSGFDYDVIITAGLNEPAGIEVIGDRLLVSEHATGEVIVYDISNPNNTPELGRIQLSSPGLMGIKIGPDGNIWGVNASTHELRKATPDANVGINDDSFTKVWNIVPNPALDNFSLSGSREFKTIEILDASGKLVLLETLNGNRAPINIQELSEGFYTVRATDFSGNSERRSLVVSR